MRALGIVEVVGNSTSVIVADIMLKTSKVNLLTTEKALGGRLVTIVMEGSTSDINEAVNAVVKRLENTDRLASYCIINNPHEVTEKLILKSEERLKAGE